MRLTLCLMILLVLTASCAAADVYYVKKIGNDVYYSKSSWPNENSQTASINSIIESADAGDEVYVAAGEYIITETIILNPGVKLYGGFDASTENTPDKRKFNNLTRLDAKNKCRVIECMDTSSNSAETRLDGFVITGGYIDKKGSDGGTGAGMYNANTNLIIENCIFTGNKFNLTVNGTRGGAIYNDNSTTSIIN